VAATIIQMIIAIISGYAGDVNKGLTDALNFLEIDCRGGEFYHGHNSQGIEWIRGEKVDPQLKIDKKGRLFVAEKVFTTVRWGIRYNGTCFSAPGIIQFNVLKSNSKRGGFLIRFHVQTPVLAKDGKFRFQGKWVGYWATEAMLKNGLMAKASNGKFGKAIFADEVFPIEFIIANVNILKQAIGEDPIGPKEDKYDGIFLMSDGVEIPY
jgi:hypothetical protein